MITNNSKIETDNQKPLNSINNCSNKGRLKRVIKLKREDKEHFFLALLDSGANTTIIKSQFFEDRRQYAEVEASQFNGSKTKLLTSKEKFNIKW
jgi:hypothetical protein